MHDQAALAVFERLRRRRQPLAIDLHLVDRHLAGCLACRTYERGLADLHPRYLRIPGGSWANGVYWNGHGVRGPDGTGHPETKIVILTNLAQDKTSQEALKAQADGYIIKADIVPSQLAGIISGLL